MTISSTTDATPLRVLVLEHQSDGGPGLLAERLDAAGAQVTVAGPVRETEVPDTLDGFDALVVLGGSPGPTDDDDAPWLPGMRALMSEALEREVPTLGICLGGQMLATVAGGRVQKAAAGPEIGLVDIEITEEGRVDPLLSVVDTDGPVRAIQWHYLEASELPPGAVPLFSSATCSNQAFRVGKNAWGLQFHPEASVTSARDWSADDARNLVKLGIDAEQDVIAPVAQAETELRSTWSKLFDRWIEIARGQNTSS